MMYSYFFSSEFSNLNSNGSIRSFYTGSLNFKKKDQSEKTENVNVVEENNSSESFNQKEDSGVFFMEMGKRYTLKKLREINHNVQTGKDSLVYGYVSSIGDSILHIEKLIGAFPGEMLFFNLRYSKTYAQVYDVYTDGTCSAVVLGGKQHEVSAGEKVVRSGYPVRVSAGFGVLGMVVHGTNHCINMNDFNPATLGYYKIFNTRLLPLERRALGIVERSPVRFPVLTGFSLVDKLIPIGCGQRELVIGDKNTGKTSLAVSIILNQRFYNFDWFKRWRILEKRRFGDVHSSFKPCVYVSVGQRRSEINRIYDVLKEYNALRYSHVYFTVADDNPGLQYLGPFAGTSICELFSVLGYDSILIFDDLSNHAVAYRQVSLLLRRPPGREAYPGDVFYTHSRLLERTAQLVKGVGAGSITCFPVIETKGNDISAFIPTNVISITDGQIFLSLDAVRKGMRPAIELGLSVSRVGSSAQPKAVSQVAALVKKDYMQYKSFEGLDDLGGVTDPIILTILTRGRKLKRLFKQPLYGTLRLYKQIVCGLFISNGHADNIPDASMLMYLANIFNAQANKYLSRLNDKQLRHQIGFVIINLKYLDQFFYSHNLNLHGDIFDKWGELYSRFFRANLREILNGSLTNIFEEAIDGLFGDESRSKRTKKSKEGGNVFSQKRVRVVRRIPRKS